MNDYIQRGYTVQETGAVYLTPNLDKTAEWFANTLGWYYSIDGRDEAGNGCYGCVYDIPTALEQLGVVPFRGLHILGGEPKGGKLALIRVKGLDALHRRITDSGWQHLTAIADTDWARKFDLTTLDGYVLEFFEF